MLKPVPSVLTMLNSLTELLMTLKVIVKGLTLKIIVKLFTTGQRFALWLFQDQITCEDQVKANGGHTHKLDGTKTQRHA
jgi:hypothetical protein